MDRKSISLTLASVALGFGPATAAVTYVDATSGNTTLADGSAGTWLGPVGTTVDGLWDNRTGFANGGAALQGGIGEDAPRIQTSASGLQPHSFYNMKAYFWGASGTQGWRGRASEVNTTSGDLPGFNTNHSAASAFDGMTPVTRHVNGGTNGAPLSTDTGGAPATENGGYFANAAPVLTVEGNRALYEVDLGTALADASGTASVFVDDLANTNSANRVFYDGIGYELNSNYASADPGAPVYALDIDTTQGGSSIETASGFTSLDVSSPTSGNGVSTTIGGVTFTTASADGSRNRDSAGGHALTTDFLFDDGGNAATVVEFTGLPLLGPGRDYQVEVWGWDESAPVGNQIVGLTYYGTHSGPLPNESIFTTAFNSSLTDPYVFLLDDELVLNNSSRVALFTRENNANSRSRLNALRITVAVVPEPSRALLLGFGLLALVARRRRSA